MKTISIFLAITTISVLWIIAANQSVSSQSADNISTATLLCLACHETVTPGIVADWRTSKHSKLTPSMAFSQATIQKLFTAESGNQELTSYVTGCAECHTLNTDLHKDSFEHNGYTINVVVSPNDCSACHETETLQYAENIMSHAYGNLMDNPVYLDLMNNINMSHKMSDRQRDLTNADSCLHCHGTMIEVGELVTIQTSMGEMDFPQLHGWPNQGVGRINPDGSKGSCTSCHPRHGFRIEVARKPSTCSECHKGPDVPAYKVYEVSKHGNIYASLSGEWDFGNDPWVVGKDFTAPTCATCHMSKIVTSDGTTIVERTHKMNDRLAHRLFGPIYVTPHPIAPDTSIIRSPGGLPIPTDLDGLLLSEYFIDAEEMAKRNERMKSICVSCHSTKWIDGHFERLENTIETTNEQMLEATLVMIDGWERGVAHGLGQNDSIFNETLELMWVEQWLFYANSVRFASAMGGADYGVFADGRWQMSKNLQAMKEYIELKSD